MVPPLIATSGTNNLQFNARRSQKELKYKKFFIDIIAMASINRKYCYFVKGSE